ncbi:efflux ABC transporter, permease protein [Gleimia coleocanis DSM 15436]|uniref:Efflux ABC transporter, permease protein n=1 Tax=Gleimia coleocanis DSM 15436 TaxID=525245 RepID=C0W202_9ACTO|nr:ABC transporter permease [Gleimia coleocanis]EEH63216.1 efflux ABC transporter, permease protein [Gleimia coleocanis DSM 15436]
MQKPNFKSFNPLSVWGAIIEAWEELIINKGRVILSLTGVAAAVWAMATVIALGGIISDVQEKTFAQWNGRSGTVRVFAQPGGSEETSGPEGGGVFADEFSEPSFSEPTSELTNLRDINGQVIDPFADAALRTVDLLKSNYWSREVNVWGVRIQAPNMLECVERHGECAEQSPSFYGIDPGYVKIFSHELLLGRFLNERDAQLQMNPVVVNEIVWELMNKPDLNSFPRFRLGADQNISYTVVGVIKSKTEWDQPMIYTNYETFMASLPDELLAQTAGRTLLVVAPEGKQKQATEAIVATLKGQLGPKWTINDQDNGFDGLGNLENAVTGIIAAIGGVVIALGALGLLTVSIVTVRFRVREIGIRRAMGASAKRIFLSVFMESVVATTVAGFIGVILSILTIRISPLISWMQVPVDINSLAYPMQAALLGVLIAAGVGALAGIIPATIAVRVKPIDAIRF